jgi:hypothetical protein
MQLRLFSRDKPLTLADSLEIVPLDSEPLVLSVFDSSLLVYTADNTFHHFLIRHVRGSTPRLRVCGSIGFEGVVADPKKVRGLSWLVPKSQQRAFLPGLAAVLISRKLLSQASETPQTTSTSQRSSSSSLAVSSFYVLAAPHPKKSSTICRSSPTRSSSTGRT